MSEQKVSEQYIAEQYAKYQKAIADMKLLGGVFSAGSEEYKTLKTQALSEIHQDKIAKGEIVMNGSKPEIVEGKFIPFTTEDIHDHAMKLYKTKHNIP